MNKESLSPEQSLWILVPLAARDATASTVRSVLENTASPDRLWLIGTDLDLAEMEEALIGRPYRVSRVDDRPSCLDAVKRAVREGVKEDLLLLAPGMEAVPLFDARLSWSAHSQQGVVAVSPLSEADILTSLRRFGIAVDDPSAVDQHVSCASTVAAIDSPYVVPECVYFRVNGLPSAEELEAIDEFPQLVKELLCRGLVLALAPHVYLPAASCVQREAALLDGAEVSTFLADSELHRVAQTFFDTAPVGSCPPIRSRSRPRVLHVTHSLGGGLERWVRIFCGGDDRIDNLVLKSIGERGRFGSQLWLYESPDALRPIRTWKMARPVPATVVGHLGYRRALDEITSDFGIDGVIVSSLIGHSLDALQSGLPTVALAHDYYPFCPALHIYFGAVCDKCGEDDLASCLQGNPLMDLFDERDMNVWRIVREEFIQKILDGYALLVAPSASVLRHYRSLVADFATLALPLVPHGGGAEDIRSLPVRTPEGRRLRVLVPGRLTRLKGGELLRQVASLCADFADFHLLGCGEGWMRGCDSHLHPVPSYPRPALPSIFEDIQPDLALLLSVVPETFSFTLSECLAAAIPPIATRAGSFEDRIEEGRNGFLCAPDALEIARLLRELNDDRDRIRDLQQRLQKWKDREASEMVADYARILGLPTFSERAYFSHFSSGGQTSSGVQIPPGSPLGFHDFLQQVEAGTFHHLLDTKRLHGWQRSASTAVARGAFGALRGLLRWL